MTFYSTIVMCVVEFNRCHCRTVYRHVMAKFIRSMLHSVICSNLIGLLKSCRVLGLRCRHSKIWAKFHKRNGLLSIA